MPDTETSAAIEPTAATPRRRGPGRAAPAEPLERLSFAFKPRVIDDLQAICDEYRCSKTEGVRRAINVWRWVTHAQLDGKRFQTVDPDGTVTNVELLTL